MISILIFTDLKECEKVTKQIKHLGLNSNEVQPGFTHYKLLIDQFDESNETHQKLLKMSFPKLIIEDLKKTKADYFLIDTEGN